jgi:adenine phosphoribosyltransferase
VTGPGAPGDLAARVRGLIVDVPDFPRPGVLFRDIMPLFADAASLAAVVDHVVDSQRATGFDVVAGIEARGFLLAAPIAYAAGRGVIAIRKAGRLPGPTWSTPYDLEYGVGVLELQHAALRAGERVLLVDDVLATGGTLGAAVRLIEGAEATVTGIAVVVELSVFAGPKLLPVVVDSVVVL